MSKNKSSAGFILTEVMIACLLSGFVVLGVIAILMPLQKLMRQQKAWIDLQQSARLATMVLIKQLKDSEIVSGSAHRFEIQKNRHKTLFFVQKTNRRYSNHQNIASLYLRESLKKSEEWVAGIASMNLKYDVVDKKNNAVQRCDEFKQDKNHAVSGMEINLQLTADCEIQESWGIYIAIKKQTKR